MTAEATPGAAVRMAPRSRLERGQEKNRDAVRRVFEDVFEGGDVDAVDELFERDAVFHSTARPEGPTRGRKEYKEFVRSFLDAFSEVEAKIIDLVAERDLAVARAVVSATHTGRYRGIPATGRRIDVPEMVMVRGVDGRCAEAWSAFDTLTMMKQLGLFPKGEPPRALLSVVIALQKAGRRIAGR